MPTDRSRTTPAEPRAIAHPDGITSPPSCDECGETLQLVMLERFTGWWCPAESEHAPTAHA